MTVKKDTSTKDKKNNPFRCAEEIEPPVLIPTGLTSLDLVLGGWPLGRVVELYGNEGCGKSTLALMAVGEAQRMGLGCVYVDLERTYNTKYAELMGVNNKVLPAPTYNTGEEALDAVKQMITDWDVFKENWEESIKKKTKESRALSDKLGLIVIDSVAALVPEAERNSDIGDANMGVIARMMSKMGRNFAALLDDNNVCIIFINQLRATINSMSKVPYTTTGGNALKYYATIRLDLRRIGKVDVGGVDAGSNIQMVVKKDKNSGNQASIITAELFHGKGFSIIGDIITLSLNKGLTTQSGAWYNYNNESFQGKGAFKIWLKDNPDKLQELKNRIKSGS